MVVNLFNLHYGYWLCWVLNEFSILVIYIFQTIFQSKNLLDLLAQIYTGISFKVHFSLSVLRFSFSFFVYNKIIVSFSFCCSDLLHSLFTSFSSPFHCLGLPEAYLLNLYFQRISSWLTNLFTLYSFIKSTNLPLGNFFLRVL